VPYVKFYFHAFINHTFSLYLSLFDSDYETDFQVAFEDGTSTSYALASSQERGQMFIGPGLEVYKGQIVGIHQRPGDLALNVCKKKAATNVRSNKEQTGEKQLCQSCAFSSCYL